MDYKKKYYEYKNKYLLFRNNYEDIKKIKNNITMTMDNIAYFSNVSSENKKYLLKFAIKYHHKELEKILLF
jgi:hypothetical protein